ncbi:MAG TPA: DUF1806 family protein [Jeotgalicoccus sp.]|nr:DUF1806 family protein [Jeotgalicoccus sp.]
MKLKPLDEKKVQSLLDAYKNEPVYIHVEVTNGVYASHNNDEVFNAGTFLRNIPITYTEGTLKGGNNFEHRVGLKLDNGGWVYVTGLSHYTVNENDEFILHGIDHSGKLAAALEISRKEFKK